jgi:hypothetical protein
MESTDLNNNQNDAFKSTDFGIITKDTVEAELDKLKIIEEDYYSDDDYRVNKVNQIKNKFALSLI